MKKIIFSILFASFCCITSFGYSVVADYHTNLLYNRAWGNWDFSNTRSFNIGEGTVVGSVSFEQIGCAPDFSYKGLYTYGTVSVNNTQVWSSIFNQNNAEINLSGIVTVSAIGRCGPDNLSFASATTTLVW